MMFLTHVQSAIKQLLANKGKAFLTMLGIIIGIGSVIMIMTLGEIAKQFLLGQISQFGTNVVEVGINGTIGPFQNEEPLYFNLDDIKQLESSSLLADQIDDISSGYTVGATAEYDSEPYSVSVWGDTPAVFTVNNLELVAGRLFRDNDVDSSNRVMVLSKKFAEDLFTTPHKALNKTISIDGTTFTIIGVVADLPFSGPFGSNFVFMPLTTVYDYIAPAEERDRISFILVAFKEDTEPTSFQNRLIYEIKRIKQIDQNDDSQFYVANREQFLAIFNNVLIGIQLFVAAIAAISLVVGGIGIMNIMLVTVKERTKEIGLRKAVGAKNRSILMQFLIEAAVLTTIGGLIGIVISLSFCWIAVLIVNAVQPDWNIQFVFVPFAIILACAVSMTTGIVFGLYPAIKAARLHPIEALRYE